MNLIIDFDSTIVQTEGLDLLAEICCKEDLPQLIKIKQLTNLGMEGELSIQESLKLRLELINAKKSDLDVLIEKLIDLISPSIHFLQTTSTVFPNNTYVVSGGFLDYVWPVCKKIGFHEHHVFANRFVYRDNRIIDFDSKNSLAKNGGKAEQIAFLNLSQPLVMIGDGYTDYEVKKACVADYFIAYTETISRQKIMEKADYTCKNFSEVVNLIPSIHG